MDSTLAPGTRLGRYELLTPIARGGMAAVWAARQTGSHGFHKTVALKTILPELSDDPQFESMFLAEARNAMRIHHPNVVQTLDLGEEGGVTYLVMEWVDGESLSTLLKLAKNKGAVLPMPLALFLATGICRGLHAAHEVTDDDDVPLGIVHRDVSPQNVMITHDGHAKLADFGVAKSHLEGAATVVGQLKGKIPYMAPEQALGRRVDRRTDVFAMGILLYRLTVGTHPFGKTNDDVVTLRNILDAPPVRPAEIAPTFPALLERLILRCLEKDPDARFQSAAELAAALEEATSEVGTATEHALATFVKTHAGEARLARRAAMRDAAKALGWAYATTESMPRISMLTPTPGVVVHERGGSAPSSNPSGSGVGSVRSVTGSQPSFTPSSTRASAAISQAPPPRRESARSVALGVAVVAALVTAGIGTWIATRVVSSHGQPQETVAAANAPPVAASQSIAPAAPPSTAEPKAVPTASQTAAPSASVASSSQPSERTPRTPRPRVPSNAPSASPGWQTGPDLGF